MVTKYYFFENWMLSQILFVRNCNVVTQANAFYASDHLCSMEWKKFPHFYLQHGKNEDRITWSGHRRFAFRKCPHLWHARLHKQIKRKQDGFCFLWKQYFCPPLFTKMKNLFKSSRIRNKGWFDEFDTGLNIIIAIVQKV